jgi:hypothetical protein
MPALADLVVNLTAQTAEFSTKLDAANRDVQKFANNVGKQLDSLKSIGQTLVTALAVDRIGEWVKATADVEDRIGKLSQSYGIGVETLSAYSYAAKMSGIDQEQLARGMGFLAKNADANSAVFKRLGIDTRDSVTKELLPLDQILLNVADSFSTMRDSTEKAALAKQIFGRAGIELIPILNRGRDGIRELIAEAKALGVVFTTEGVRTATEYSDNIKRLDAAMLGMSARIGNSVLPALSAVATAMTEEIKDPESPLATAVEFLTNRLKDLAASGIAGIATAKEIGLEIKNAGAQVLLVNRNDFAGLEALQVMQAHDAEAIWEKARQNIASIYGAMGTPAAPPKKTGDVTGNDTAKQKDYTAALKTFLDEVNSINMAVAKASDDALAVINLKWEERRTKLETDFKKLSATLQSWYGVTYRFEQGQIFGGRQAEINAEFAKIPKLLEEATKAANQFVLEEAKMKPFPNFGFGGPAAMPNFMSDQVGAQLDRFRNDQTAQSALMDDVFKNGLSMAQQYNIELAKLDIAWGQLPPAIKASLEAQDAYSKAVGALKDKLDVNTMAMKDFSEQSIQAVEGAMMMSGSWSNALKAIAADLTEMILKMTIFKKLNEASGSSGGGWLGAIAGVITNMLGGGSGSVTTSLDTSIFHPGPVMPPTGPSGILGTLPGFASGGDVAPNEWVTVGEHGPEPFHAGPSGGTVFPHGSAAPGGAANVQVVVNNQGSPKDAQVGKARFDRAARQFVVEVVMTDVRQNGPLRGLMGRQ